MSYDSMLVLLGDFGPYHKRAFILLSLIPIFNAFYSGSITYHSIEPNFRCAIPNYNDSYIIQNDVHQGLVNSTVVFDEENNQFSRCSIYNPGLGDVNDSAGTSNRSVEDCHTWVYEPSPEARMSTVVEFDIVCDRKVLKTHVKTAMMAGLVVGCLVGGTLLDLFGRKRVLLVYSTLQATVGVLYAFVTHVYLMFLGRFLLSFINTTIFSGTFVMMAEVVAPRRRALATMGTMFGWCVGLFLLDLVFYVIRDWQTAQLVLAAPGFLIISYWWLLPESPRWLLIHNRKAEAEVIIRKMATVNKVKLPDSIDALLSSGTDKETKQRAIDGHKNTIWHLLSSKILMIRILILMFSWLSVSMVYQGLALNVEALIEGDIIVNMALQAAMELIAYTVCIVVLERVGRKKIYCTFILLGGLACIATSGPLIAGKKIKWISISLFSIGRLGVTGAFAIVYIVTTEQLPTAFRNSCLGLCSFAGGLGAVISPYIANLQIYIPSVFGKTLPLLIFGICSIVAGLTALTLPETKDKKLPETIAEAEALGSSSQKSKSDDLEVVFSVPDEAVGGKLKLDHTEV